jgi:uncharacterized repeat protein (TIGR02543 family)
MNDRHCFLNLTPKPQKAVKFRRRYLTLGTLILLICLLSLYKSESLNVSAATPISFIAEELLGKPTDTSITINIVPGETIECHYQYRVESESYSTENQTETLTAEGGEPHEVTISGLLKNTRYFYHLRYRKPGETDWVTRSEHTFHTQRDIGESFVFTVTADSHNATASNTSFTTAINNILADEPDFHVDLGDTQFAEFTRNASIQTNVNNAYLEYRAGTHFGAFGHSTPVFLSSGNHEEEEGWNLDDSYSRGVADIQARKAFFPTPVDDGIFYTGNTDLLAAIDEAVYGDKLREDYYAWEWGDALFVVIDPFQYTTVLPYSPIAGEEGDETVTTTDQWVWTLGEQQYDWLKQTLRNSSANYKFMFSHQMVGGIPDNSVSGGAGYVRGGAEAAGYFEWGGRNFNGTEGFSSNRPGWEKPIHDLMVETGVSAYFHGHDHQFVYEIRDGIVYQEVPSPSMTGSGFAGIYAEGTYSDYETIEMLPNAGHLRITIASEQATVEYVRSNTTGVSYTYTIEPSEPQTTHDLTISVDPASGGTTNPAAGLHTYAEDSVVNVTATANTGYVFDSWSGACTGSGSCQVTMDGDKTVTAHFEEIETYTLTTVVNPPGGGTVIPSGSNDYNSGTVVNITATAASGYTFLNWTGDVTDPNSSSTTIIMNSDKTVTANFVLIPTFDLTMQVSPGGGGTTTPSAGVHTYQEDAVVLIGASPSTGYTFTNWTGDVANPTSASTSVTMNSDKTVTANFELIPTYELTVQINPGGGGITTPSAGVHTYQEDTVVPISASAASGYTFSNWTGDVANPTSASTTVTIDNDKTITANFVLIPTYELTMQVSPEGGGTTTPSVGVHTYQENTIVPISASAAANYTFSNWTGDVANPTSVSTTVTMDSDKTLTANFSPIKRLLTVVPLGSGNGVVTSVPSGIDCGSNCIAEFDHGTEVVLSATAAPGSVFTGWSGSGCSGTDECVVTMTAARTVTATFTITQRTLILTLLGDGEGQVMISPLGVTCSAGPCAYGVNYGTVLTLTVNVEEGSIFSGWGSACSGTEECEVTMDENKTITATFKVDKDEFWIYLPLIMVTP